MNGLYNIIIMCINNNNLIINPLAPNDIYTCRAVSPLNGRTAIKVDGGGGFNSGAKDKIPASKG